MKKWDIGMGGYEAHREGLVRCQEVMVWKGPVNMKGSLRSGQRSRYHKRRVAKCHVKTEAGLWGGSLKRGGLGGEGHPSQ